MLKRRRSHNKSNKLNGSSLNGDAIVETEEKTKAVVSGSSKILLNGRVKEKERDVGFYHNI